MDPQEDPVDPAVDRREQEHEKQRHKGDLGRSSDVDEGTVQPALGAMDRQYAIQTNVAKHIHIIGIGSIGKLVAHALHGIPNPPSISLIFHRHDLFKMWMDSKKTITIRDDGFDVARRGYEAEFAPGVRRQHGVVLDDDSPDVYDLEGLSPHQAAESVKRAQEDRSAQNRIDSSRSPSADGLLEDGGPGRTRNSGISNDTIHNLIIMTKAAKTISALTSVRHRLKSTSTICFIQNGMGIIDDVNKHVFPDEAQRPNYMQGIITHGANVPAGKSLEDPFYAVHAGLGTIALSLLPRSGKLATISISKDGETEKVESEKWADSSRYLLRTLTRVPVLCAVGFTPIELFQQQLEKLAVNSVLNPLTSLLDNRNGALLYNFALTRTMRLMLAETSAVMRSLPELRAIPNVNLRFSPDRLETLVVSVANKTKDNISSMLADVRAGRQTEIEYINGYIVRRGEEVGIKCVVNYAIMQTVIGKCQMTQREQKEEIPVQKPPPDDL